MSSRILDTSAELEALVCGLTKTIKSTPQAEYEDLLGLMDQIQGKIAELRSEIEKRRHDLDFEALPLPTSDAEFNSILDRKLSPAETGYLIPVSSCMRTELNLPYDNTQWSPQDWERYRASASCLDSSKGQHSF